MSLCEPEEAICMAARSKLGGALRSMSGGHQARGRLYMFHGTWSSPFQPVGDM